SRCSHRRPVISGDRHRRKRDRTAAAGCQAPPRRAKLGRRRIIGMSTGAIRTGTAGWVFEPWRGTFFPQGLVQKKELAYASSRLGSIEINATFRVNLIPESFTIWAGEARDGFVFSIKGPQLVTHIKRLKHCEQELANFFASGPLALGAKLGPFVWQLPP